MEAKPQTILGPNKGLNSSNLDPSVIRVITSLISKGFFSSGSTSPSRSSGSLIGSSGLREGLFPLFRQFKCETTSLPILIASISSSAR